MNGPTDIENRESVVFDTNVIIEQGEPAVTLQNPREERTRRFLNLVLQAE
jgi:ABC-type polar amino acid transport system ATPase subunit